MTTTNTPRAGESVEQTKARRDRGYVQRTAAMTQEQRDAMQKALAGEDPKAVVVIPASNLRAGLTLWLPTNGLNGARVNEDGDGI